jgi:protein gp37
VTQPSRIEWTEYTWNPLRGCSRISEGCRNCYAERTATRYSAPGLAFHGFAVRTSDGPRWTGRVELVEGKLLEPLSLKAPARVFVNSMSDLFHEAVPFDVIDRIFAVMAMRPDLTFQVLTKRADRMREYMTDHASHESVLAGMIALAAEKVRVSALERFVKAISGGYKTFPPDNVWLGVSVEDQPSADGRIPQLLDTPAALRWLSVEPLLGPVTLHAPGALGRSVWNVDWIVAGGESGPDARPCDPRWIRTLRDEAAGAEIPFFFKQWGEWLPGTRDRAGLVEFEYPFSAAGHIPAGGFALYEFGDNVVAGKVGKHAAGRLLDSREHSEYPEVRP